MNKKWSGVCVYKFVSNENEFLLLSLFSSGFRPKRRFIERHGFELRRTILFASDHIPIGFMQIGHLHFPVRKGFIGTVLSEQCSQMVQAN